MQLIIKLKSDLCVSVGKGFASMIDIDTALDEFGIPYIPSRRLKGCLRELAGYRFKDENIINELFGKTGSDKPGSLRISDARIKEYTNIVKELIALREDKICAEEVTELFCSVRRETSIDNGTASEKSLRSVRVVNMQSPITKQELEFVADIDFDIAFKEDIKVLIASLRNIGYHRFRGLGAVECTFSEHTSSNGNASERMICESEEFDNADGIRITVRLESDLMLPQSDTNSSTDYIPGSLLLGASASKYVMKNSDKDFNKYFYSDVKFGNLYPAVRHYDDNNKKYVFSYTVPAPRFFAKDKNTGELFNCVGNSTEGKRKKILKKGYMTADYKHVTPETKIVYHNANIASDEQQLYMQHCLASGQFYSGEIYGSKEKIKTIADLFQKGELYFGRSKTAQYSRCSIYELIPLTRTEKVLTPRGVSAFVLESDVCLMKSGTETVDLTDLCSVLGVDAKKLDPETSVSVRTISGYNAKWNLKKPQFPVFSAGSCLVFRNDALSSDTVEEYRLIGERQNEGFGRVRFISEANSLDASEYESSANPENESRVISDLIAEQKNMNIVFELALDKYKEIRLNASQIGRIALMAKEADHCAKDRYEDFVKRLENIKKDVVKEEAKKSFGDLKGIFENKKILRT